MYNYSYSNIVEDQIEREDEYSCSLKDPIDTASVPRREMLHPLDTKSAIQSWFRPVDPVPMAGSIPIEEG